MSLNLDSLLKEYKVETSPLSQFFWRKERKADGVSYPIPLKQPYVDFVKLVLGLHLIEMERLDHVEEVELKTSYPQYFSSIKERLESLFFLLSNLDLKLTVTSTSHRSHWQRFDEQPNFEKVVLFSGGLDSMCGALDMAETHKVILSHCITNQVIFGKVMTLSNMAAFRKSILYCCDARTESTTGGISETRGLLFLSFAYAIAASLDVRSIVFCENGAQMLDALLGSLIYPNKQATKNTNPIYIDRIQEIFSSFANVDFKIELPFRDKTKAEVVLPFKDMIKFEDIYSCFSTRFRNTMCGICYNCFIRRLSLLAIGVKEQDAVYEINPFVYDPQFSDKKSFRDTMDILFHLLRFYHKILMQDPTAIDELKISARSFFQDPLDLATRFAKDLFLGVENLLETIDESRLNGLGKKAVELLDQTDRNLLIERKEQILGLK